MKANGWPVKRVGEIAQCSLGKMLDRAKNQGTPRPYLRNVNVRWFSFDLSDLIEMRFLDEEAEKFTAVKGDVLICEGGYPGRAAIWEEDYPIHFQKAVHRVRFHERERNKWFLYYLYYLESTGALQKYFTGTGIQHFTGQVLKQLPIALPPLLEQQRIVGILDEAFAGIATAKANAEKNLRNAREMFESKLQGLFEDADGWEQKTLAEIGKFYGRGKSRHRPRNEPKLYGGKYPFIQTGDVRNADRFVESYTQTYSEMGLAQSKLWPAGTVCITIAANIAETAILGFDACIPDSIIGLVADETKADNVFVLYLLRSFKAHLQAQGKGSAQHNINMGTFEEQSFPFPALKVQREIVESLDSLSDQVLRLESIYQQKLAALDALKKSLLHQAFTGQLLTAQSTNVPAAIPFPVAISGISTTDLHAGILAMAYALHEQKGTSTHFGHVKAEKIAHMVEAHLGIDLGRNPVRDAAGPNDFDHLKKVEYRARKANYFDFQRVEGRGYRVKKLRGFARLIDKAHAALGARAAEVDQLLAWMLPFTTKHAEVIATVYAAWNNLLLDGVTPTDEQIVHAAREDWHPSKLNINRENFFKTLAWLRTKQIVPQGRGKRVGPKGT